MKVRDLIADTVFTPGGGRSSERPPRVTVILPTFRRGDSGMLRRALDSLLGQSFTDFELLVVDDASVDSTATVIGEIMARDPRVSVLRHTRNIGLPAISEFEAFTRARGELISFAFDDTVFSRHGLRDLVRESDRAPGALIAGFVRAFSRSADGSISSDVLGRDARESDLLTGNVIPNSAVLAPKSIFEVVGLYDPHVSLARLCDYDLWQRVRRRFPIRFVDRCIGEEHGPATSDSLGATYPLDRWLSDDRMRQERDQLLTPQHFPDMDVFDTRPFASDRSRRAVTELVAIHRSTRPQLPAPPSRAIGSQVPRVLVLARPIDASVQLVFESLREIPDLHVRMVDPHRHLLSELAGADVLVVARQIRDNEAWVRAARALGLGLLYYLDDNLPLMAASGELDRRRTEEFDPEALRGDLASFDGVLTSTESLAAGFRELRLHGAITVVPISAPSWASQTRLSRDRIGSTTLALFVGHHRLASFGELILPALAVAAERAGQHVRVLVPGPLPGREAEHDLVEIVEFDPSSDYFAAVRELARRGTDAIVIPDSESVNAGFKTVHPVLSAALVGAAVVLPATPPYLETRATEGVHLVDDPRVQSGWTTAFAEVLRARSGGMDTVPRALLTTRFDAEAGAASLRSAIAHVRLPPSPERRAVLLTDWLAAELARQGNSPAAHGTTQDRRANLPDVETELHAVARHSRRLHAFRRQPSPLARFDNGPERYGFTGAGGRLELSPPLARVPYLAYRLDLAVGRYAAIEAIVWADGRPGDLFGIELVDPEGHIVLNAVEPLPASTEPVDVSIDARGLHITRAGEHEVRVFVRSGGSAFLLENVARGRFGLSRPRVTPLVRFVPQ
jgi:hypothetical protein